jgi:S1-C subfamily serine protease
MTGERIAFEVPSDEVVSNLHSSLGTGPFPPVVVGCSMTSVKEQVTGVYSKLRLSFAPTKGHGIVSGDLARIRLAGASL